MFFFFFSSRRRHTRSLRDWSSDVCSSDLLPSEVSQVSHGKSPRPWRRRATCLIGLPSVAFLPQDVCKTLRSAVAESNLIGLVNTNPLNPRLRIGAPSPIALRLKHLLK